MKTDELIDILSTNVEAVDHRQTGRTIGVALAAGAAVAAVAVIVALGLRSDLTGSALAFLLLKIGFAVGVLVPASVYLFRLARPGGERKMSIWLVALPFMAITLLAALSLASAPSQHRNGMVAGHDWLECLVSIPIIAIAPFALIVWAVRHAAPTDLARAGAVVGLIAGSLSAAGYAFHCVDDSVPFVAVWYGGTIALCTLAGWMLGPRLLRW